VFSTSGVFVKVDVGDTSGGGNVFVSVGGSLVAVMVAVPVIVEVAVIVLVRVANGV